MEQIVKIKAREILDSRGNPTIEVDLFLSDGAWGRASVPSGASTGSLEACEMRDNDSSRYLGKGVLKAISNVNQEIFDNLKNFPAFDQAGLDKKLIKLDGTKNKSRLGANAILGVSLAYAKACAASRKMPFFRYISEIGKVSSKLGKPPFPMPMMNIINGGAHADNSIDIQEFMIMPIAAKNLRESVRMGAEVFHHLKKLLKLAGHNVSVGDEGGFAPNLASSEEAILYILNAMKQAGYEAGKEIALTLDAAASEFYFDGKYHLKGEGKILTSSELIDYYEQLCEKYPIISIEDPCSEHDHQGWIEITKRLGSKIQLVGDDLFVTNPEILKEGIAQKMANAILIKVNQIGTLSETFEAIDIAHLAGYKTIISHRSGETEDTYIAHIAVGIEAAQIKTGSLSRSDRTAKYNELLRIEEDLV